LLKELYFGKIIDSHCHIFPKKIAEKASKSIGDFYNIPILYDGTTQKLFENGNIIGVNKYLVCSTATKPEQVRAINDYLYDECENNKNLYALGTLHPDMKNIGDEVEYIISLGFKGIKLHPDFQKINIDDIRMLPIYEAAQGRLPILFHVGDNRYDFSDPIRLLKILKSFPRLVAIAAHLGGYLKWNESMDLLSSKENVFIDTCSSLFKLDPQNAINIIRTYGTQKCLFGTDYPMWDHFEELNRLEALSKENQKNGLSIDEYDYIMYKNSQKLFNL
jgi:uncharacterized protein